MSPKQLILIAGLGSALLLIGAWGFQALGYAPCKMCIWQRWPHGAAVAFAAMAMVSAPVVLWAALGALSALTTAGIGLFHTGVERDWWEGPASCTSAGGLGDNLLPGQADITVVLCDEVSWAWLGLSMASWNALASFCLVLIWSAAVVQTLRS